jgi:tripartite-type tricarboxylate transporter receptor subunit TctC
MPMTLRRRFLRMTIPIVGSVGFVRPLASQAQDALDSLKILCGYPPGGPTDLVSRWVADKLTGNYAKAALVDNRPGAAGRVVIDALKSSPTNGKTMLLTPSSVLTLYPYLFRQLSYNPITDLTPVSVACEHVHGLAMGPAVPDQVRSVADFVAWAKANPAKANCGNPGEGSSPHLLTAVLAKASGAPIQAVPYRGGVSAMTDLISGQLASAMLPEGVFLPYTADRRARVIATTGPTRSQFYADVPTFAEQGLQHMVYTEWFGFFMPAGTSGLIVNVAADAVAKALGQLDLINAFAKAGLVATRSTPAELAERLSTELAYRGPEVKSLGFNLLD